MPVLWEGVQRNAGHKREPWHCSELEPLQSSVFSRAAVDAEGILMGRDIGSQSSLYAFDLSEKRRSIVHAHLVRGSLEIEQART